MNAGRRWPQTRCWQRGAFCLLVVIALALPVRAATFYVTVAGLGGEPDYDQRFTGLANDLDKLYKTSGNDVHVFTLTGPNATKEKLAQTLNDVARQAKPSDDFVLMLIGHGSFDGVEYKFNLVGPDITAADLASLCDHIPAKRQLIVNTTSASGGSVAALEKPGRAVIAATKSGTEKNATIFARYWVEALHDPSADTDKNETISALEAFQYADRKTAEFYESQKRLATEHAVLEDTGEGEPVRSASMGQAGQGSEGNFLANFAILRTGSALKEASDPAKRELLAKKEDMEQKIDILKYQKASMDEEDYRKQLTEDLLELAKLQEELDK